jgi:hypothetical protein
MTTTKPELVPLKPCPFCGGEAKLCRVAKGGPFLVMCGEVVGCLWIGPCQVKPKTEPYRTRPAAVRAWNRRLTSRQGLARKEAYLSGERIEP